MADFLTRFSELQSLDDFIELARWLAGYMTTNLVGRRASTTNSRDHYEIWTVRAPNGSQAVTRPVNAILMLDQNDLDEYWDFLLDLLPRLVDRKQLSKADRKFILDKGIEKTLYTVYQLVGCGVDALVADANQARKLFGAQFERLIHAVLGQTGLETSSVNYSKNYVTQSGARLRYRYQIDLVVRRSGQIATSRGHIDNTELFGSIKTSSKDRMQKIFVDKTLLERVSGAGTLKFIGVFHNDVQRVGASGVSVTFVPRLFLIYGELLTRTDGVYYLDPPPHIEERGFRGRVKWFSELLVDDIWNLV